MPYLMSDGNTKPLILAKIQIFFENLRNTFQQVLSSPQPTHGVEFQAVLVIDGKEVNPCLEILALADMACLEISSDHR